MATKLFLRDTKNNGIGVYRDMLTAAGSSSTTGVVTTDASTQKQWEKTSGGELLEWISGRSPSGGWTFSGLCTFSIWAHESATSANAGGRVRLFKRTAAGVETEIGGGPYDDGVEFTKSTPTEMTWTGTPNSTAFAENDRLVVKYYITNVGSMGTGQTCTLTYDAADAATGDSFLQINETITFKPEPVPVNVQPGVGTLTATGFAAAITQIIRIAVSLGTLTATGFAPVVHVNQNVRPGVGSVSVSGHVPTIALTQNVTVQPGVGVLTASGLAPTIGAFQLTTDWLVTLASGENGPHGMVFAEGYVFIGLQTTPGKLIRINPANPDNYDVLTFPNDGEHDQIQDLTYIPAKGKLYCLFRETGRCVVDEVDPQTLARTTVINDTTSPCNASNGSFCFDSTYLYVLMYDNAPSSVVRYQLSDWSRVSSVQVNASSTYTYGHVLRSDGSDLYAAGAINSAPYTHRWIVKISQSTFAVVDTADLTLGAAMNITDDACFTADYVWFGLEGLGHHVMRVSKSDLDSYTLVGAVPAYSCYGALNDGQYILGLIASNPGELLRIVPSTLATARFVFPSGQDAPNEFCQNGDTVYFAFYLSPGKIAALRTSQYGDIDTYRPAVGSLSAVGYAPTIAVTQGATVQPGVGTLTASGLAPVIGLTDHKTVNPPVGTLTAAGFAPVIHLNPNVRPDAGTLSASGYVPALSITETQLVQPGVGTLSASGHAPIISLTDHKTVQPDVGAASLSGFAPIISLTDHKTASPPVGELNAVGFTPIVHLHPTVYPSTGSLTITGYVPVVTATAVLSVQPATGELAATGFVPTVVLTDHKFIQPTTGTVAATGFIPTVTATDHKTIQPAVGTIALIGYAPLISLTDHQSVQPSIGALSFSGYAPVVSIAGGITVYPGVGTLTLIGCVPSVTVPTAHTSTLSRTLFADSESRASTITVEDRQSEVDSEVRLA